MRNWSLSTQSYFDGETLHGQGPYHLSIRGGKIAEITTRAPAMKADEEAAFVMPGLVEAHAHLFLDGGMLNFKNRSAHLKADPDKMMEAARRNVADSLAAGITLIRDAGDRFGINHAIRDEATRGGHGPVIRSSGLAIHRAGNYGKFMSRPVGDAADIRATIADISRQCDDLKIILTGIINFEKGCVDAPLQFSEDELKLIVEVAAEHGLPTFAHCSGIEGVRVATAAGIGSIEHGFFLDRPTLEMAAEKEIAWVPTFSPVHFQWAHPEYASWSDETVAKMRRILDNHSAFCGVAHQLGTQIVAGSDAGSQGVRHGPGLIDELFFFAEAGLPMTEILISATSRPRHLWGAAPNRIATAQPAEFITLGASPYVDRTALRDVRLVVREGRVLHRKDRNTAPSGHIYS